MLARAKCDAIQIALPGDRYLVTARCRAKMHLLSFIIVRPFFPRDMYAQHVTARLAFRHFPTAMIYILQNRACPSHSTNSGAPQVTVSHDGTGESYT